MDGGYDMENESKNSCANCIKTNNKNRSWSDENAVKELTVRLNRIEGQVRGIKRMIEEGVYCDDVLNQITSAQSALYGVARLLLQKHMKSCVKEQLASGDEQVIDEVLATIFRMMR
jgi:DNA-binding FrmR family transcriptional regulator